ncbi:MAG: radical SAM protein [Lentisphaerota bacterium]
MDDAYRETYLRLLQWKGRVPLAQWPEDLKAAFQHAARVLAMNQETPDFPPVVYIEPTNACNCNCVICPRQNMTRKTGKMAMGLFLKILDDIALAGPSEIHLFNFGEPTIHPELAAMIRACRERKLTASFQTNGINLQREKVLEWLEAGLTYLGVSVNGLNAGEYETIRPGHSFAQLRENLMTLRKIIDESGHACQVHIAAQVTKQDVAARNADVETYKRTWFPVADSLSIFGISEYDHVYMVSGNQMSENQLEGRIRKPDASVRCTEPFDRLVIKWDGRATVCCVDYDARMVVGDFTTQSLREIWHSPKLNNIRATMRTQNFSRLPLCRSCPKFYSESFTLFFKKTRPARHPSPVPVEAAI